jgi:outer membrane scaffolding protein for murein synthesis (MipA/OmpV family)
LAGRWRIGDNWQLQAEAGYEKYSSEISESPLTLNDYEAEIGISLLYRF